MTFSIQRKIFGEGAYLASHNGGKGIKTGWPAFYHSPFCLCGWKGES